MLKQMKQPRYTLAGLIILVMMILAAPLRAKENTTWSQANEYYQQKKFDSALAGYQQLIQKGNAGANVYYNAGNAAYRLNQIGEAVWYYEKALAIEPGNQQIADNLALTRMRIDKPVKEIAPIFFERWWRALLQWGGTNGWAVLSLLFFAALCAVAYLSITKKISYGGRWSALAAVLFIFCLTINLSAYHSRQHSGSAVVMAKDAPLTEKAKEGAKIATTVPEGTTVMWLGEERGFMQVELPNGRRGWMALAAIKKI